MESLHIGESGLDLRNRLRCSRGCRRWRLGSSYGFDVLHATLDDRYVHQILLLLCLCLLLRFLLLLGLSVGISLEDIVGQLLTLLNDLLTICLFESILDILRIFLLLVID